MKRVRKIIITLVLVLILFTENVSAAKVEDTMQAVWIATVYNIDFPYTKDDAKAQQKEFIDRLDQLEALGINTVIVQVRPKADALYKSKINPWSDVLTGVQGKDPGYDPMAFMIEEAHSRGMQFHAWLNPYRVTTPGLDVKKLIKTHPARLNPKWLIKHNNALYYNPASKEVKKHIVDSVKEIVENYAVDAIVFDDYFYPSYYPLPKGEDKDGKVANNRRKHVNDLIKQVSEVIKKTKEDVLFGISPGGIWKNKSDDPTGSDTSGNQSYYSVYADSRAWIKNGWIDYISPQIYWEIGHKSADYETLVKWWSNQVEGTKVQLYISHGIYRDVVAKQIDKQFKINKKYSQVTGSIYYNLNTLLANKNCQKKIAKNNGKKF